MKRNLKFLLFLILLCFLCINVEQVNAKTLGQFKQELKTAESKYSKNQADKATTEAEINATKQKVNEIKAEKAQVSNDIGTLNEELKVLAEKIKKAQEEIKSIVHYYQLSSSNSIYLEYVFNASDFTDFIYRLAVSEQLSEYRETKIKEFNALVEENKKKLNELAAKQTSLANLEQEMSVELSKLNENLSELTEVSVDIKDEIKTLKSTINTYETKYKCSDSEEISACVTRYNNKNRPSSGGGGTISTPSASGFYRPVASGRVNANYGYTAYYGSFHDGMDIGIAHGTPVYSIANGYVANIMYKYYCGGNMVFIVHQLGGRYYTSLYAHLASVAVSVGQVVTPNTVIGYSGGVPSIETWDKCSTGAHLHFQMGTGAYMSDYFFFSNFSARKFDPRQLVNFPAMGSSFSGR